MTNRFDYVAYDDVAQKTSNTLKDSFVNLHEQVDGLANGREKSLAITKLEEAFMWCGKAIRNDQIYRNENKTE